MRPQKFDSPDEAMFYSWCVEAVAKGVIEAFKYQPETMQIFDKVHYQHEKQLKTKVKIEQKTALNGLSYTADFLIRGDLAKFHTPKEKIIFPKLIPSSGGLYFYIDIKGSYLQHNDAVKFSIMQKVIYHVKGIYINKIVPEKFFLKAWLPMPIQDKKDDIWTDYQVLKSGVVKQQKKRSKFKKCKTYNEKHGLNDRKQRILKLF